jgi:hypothetical protein
MAGLVLLRLGNGDEVRCVSLKDAISKAIASGHMAGRIYVEVIPEGGGPVTTLEFDRQTRDWTTE